MCKVSNNIKLCTCNKSINYDNDYWVLHRYDKNLNRTYMVGEPMCMLVLTEDFKKNSKLIEKQLNTTNPFDFEISLNNKDRLLLRINIKGLMFSFGYEYNKGRWKTIDTDMIEWMFHHEEGEEGIIQIN